jgi:uncharacterized protein with NRDE domain
MCLIFLAYDYHPQYKLVVAANRDEYYSRPTLAADFWPDNPSILAGKDLIKGGTWMGITTTGRFSAVTTYREPLIYPPHLPSRGLLAKNYLNSNDAPEVYMENLVNKASEYKGYSLLAGTFESLYYLSNRENIIRKLDKGLYGLSNSLLNVPWPKVTKGIKALADCLQHDDIKVEHLFAIMADKEPPDDKDLPDTGIGLERERMLSPACIVSPNYGTRATTVILVDHDNQIKFRERTLDPAQSGTWSEVSYELQV